MQMSPSVGNLVATGCILSDNIICPMCYLQQLIQRDPPAKSPPCYSGYKLCKEVGETAVTHPLALQTTGRIHVDTAVSNLHDCSHTGLQATPFSKDPSIDCAELTYLLTYLLHGAESFLRS
jgi:hypothetical protein